jgi:hypothetical protein
VNGWCEPKPRLKVVGVEGSYIAPDHLLLALLNPFSLARPAARGNKHESSAGWVDFARCTRPLSVVVACLLPRILAGAELPSRYSIGYKAIALRDCDQAVPTAQLRSLAGAEFDFQCSVCGRKNKTTKQLWKFAPRIQASGPGFKVCSIGEN